MKEDERLLCAPWNRDVFIAWQNGGITRAEALFLGRRVEFHCALPALPGLLVRAILQMYDALFEPPPNTSQPNVTEK